MTKQEYSYSLWLRPSQEQIDELTKIISILAHCHHRTVFPPHITLLSSLKADINTITKACEQIIETHPAFNLKLENITYLDEYFRNLYILVKPEATLISLYNGLQKQLEGNIREKFLPHVSLLYGNLDAKKQHILSKELANSYPNNFSCQRLDLYNTTGKESEWYLIKSYNFS